MYVSIYFFKQFKENVVSIFVHVFAVVSIYSHSYRNFLERSLLVSLNLVYRFKIDDLSINNSKFGYHIECIYHIELKIQTWIDTLKSDIHLDMQHSRQSIHLPDACIFHLNSCCSQGVESGEMNWRCGVFEHPVIML